MSQSTESPFAQGQILLLATDEQNYAFDLWETFRVALGRHHTSDITLGSRKVSNYHAEILNEPEGLRIRDLGSTNGTFVNGEKVRSQELREGDRIRIGGYELTLHLKTRGDESGNGVDLLPVGASGTLAALRSRPQSDASKDSGDEHGSTLPDLLKLMVKGKASALLLIKHKDGQEGRIYVDKGKVFHAESDKAKGEKALYRIFRWPESTYEVMAPSDESSLPHSIDLPVESLITDGLHQLEEIEMITPILPPPVVPLRLKEDCPLPLCELSPAEIEIFQAVIRHETIERVLEESQVTDLKILTIVLSLLKKKVFTIAEDSSALLEETFVLRSRA
jgi:pSer/pThr/pTyr-binding forkhead associated (FHA) protein